MPLTPNQILHRAYLQSPVWKVKRQEALTHYGCICGRCGEYGSDVHHKTYDRVGGNERLEDLEVLCRACHDAHHSVDRVVRKNRKSRKRIISRQALFRYLSFNQKQELKDEFKISLDGELLMRLMSGENPNLLDRALKMLGCDSSYVAKRKSQTREQIRREKDKQRSSNRL